jgi:hypothetical protein
MKTYGGVDVYIHIFLTSALVGGEWSASRPCRFIPGTHFIGGWVDPRVGLDDMEKWKFFTLPGLELPPSLIVQPVSSSYTDWAIPAPVPTSIVEFKQAITAWMRPTCIQVSGSNLDGTTIYPDAFLVLLISSRWMQTANLQTDHRSLLTFLCIIHHIIRCL